MMQPRFQSSGDLLADRRLEWARDCAAKGDLKGAADLMRQTLEIVPGYAAAWFALGSLQEKLGDRSGAIDAFCRACETDRQDKLGARLMLMRLGAVTALGMPLAYVRELFDQYAPGFDKALQESLSYRAPALLRAAVETICVKRGRPFRFASMLDLGCGTGLAGEAFRSNVDWLVGVDLSPGMIAEAKSKALYDRLVVADAAEHLAAEAAGEARYHLAVAADVFVYLADLHAVAALVARVLAPEALFAFTVETHEGDGVLLGEKLRYTHGERHVRSTIEKCGFDLMALERASVRIEKGQPVPGLLVIAGLTSPQSPA